MFTRFMDMHSGGSCKERPYEYIYIEAPIEEAKVIFYNRFNHNPERVTCTCCGDDYSISEEPSLEEATAYDRGCKWDGANKKYAVDSGIPISEFLASRKDVLVIREANIKPKERTGEVPIEGYVWL